MTSLQKYRTILHDIERLLAERAYRYFVTRYEGQESADLKVQCDAIMVVLKQWLEPHVMWFEQHHEEPLETRETLVGIDLESGVNQP